MYCNVPLNSAEDGITLRKHQGGKGWCNGANLHVRDKGSKIDKIALHRTLENVIHMRTSVMYLLEILPNRLWRVPETIANEMIDSSIAPLGV